MTAPRPDVLDFLLTRRSRPAKTLGPRAPERAEIETMLTAAARTPDHGKLTPWRFVVLATTEARREVAAIAIRHLEAQGLPADKVEKNSAFASQGGVVIAVIASPVISDKIPRWEQELSAGAVCLGLLNAALASGWGANWLTGPIARDGAFLVEALDCTPSEFVAGFIYIGDEQVVPADRDRPDIDAITKWR